MCELKTLFDEHFFRDASVTKLKLFTACVVLGTPWYQWKSWKVSSKDLLPVYRKYIAITGMS